MTGKVPSPFCGDLRGRGGYEAGRKMAELTHRWMEANEPAFREIYGFVKRMQAEGGKGRVRDRVAAFCVDRNIEVGDSPYAFNNTWWSGISRYLVLHDPSLLENPIRFRESDIDRYGLLTVSYLPETAEEGAE